MAGRELLMAVDKLVDSTQLDADLTTVANAIRTKGGTSASLSFPQGMADAIDAIPTGGGEAWISQSLSSRWAWAVFPDNYELDYDCSSFDSQLQGGIWYPIPLNSAFSNARHLKIITLQNLYKTSPSASTANQTTNFSNFALHDSYYGAYTERLEEVHIPNDTLYPSTAGSAFYNRSHLRIVDILFDMSKMNGYNYGYNWSGMFSGCTALEEVRFVPNSLLWMNTSYQLFNVSQNLSDDSLVSIANALADGSTSPAANLKLLSTPYARCSTLMGTVDGDNLFVKNEVSGTVSLADFITNTKGWTLYE